MNTFITVTKSQSLKVSKFKNLTYYMSSVFFLTSFISFSQVKDTTKVNALDEVLVSAVRVTTKTPVSFSNLNKKEIKFRNLGQDIPILMKIGRAHV